MDLQLLACLLALACQIPIINALLVRSHDSGSLATGLAYDTALDKAIVVGTTFRKDSWYLGNEEPIECFALVGNGYTPELLQPGHFNQLAIATPNVCVAGAVAMSTASPAIGRSPLAGLNVDATTSNFAESTILHSFMYDVQDQMTDSEEASNPTQPHGLPYNSLPVRIATDPNSASQAVYIAYHNVSLNSTVGADLRQAASSDNETNPVLLDHLLKFWLDVDNKDSPLHHGGWLHVDRETQGHSPTIIKKDLLTGEEAFKIQLSTLLGKSLIADIIVLPELLLVAGSTNGVEVVNHGETSNTPLGSVAFFGQDKGSEGDWDGYLTFLDPTTGTTSYDGGEQITSLRIEAVSGENEDDFINGMCVDPTNTYVYLVGNTGGIVTGIHEGGAIVIKVDINARSVVWKYQVAGVHVQGWKCVADEDAVYVGGTTSSDIWSSGGFGFNQRRTANPDGFVTRIDADTASERWTRQLNATTLEVANHRSDVIAGMAINKLGKLLVLLNSLDLHNGENDIFLFDMDPKTGNHHLGFTDLFVRANPVSGTSKLGKFEKDVNVAAIVVPVFLGLFLCVVTLFQVRARRNSSKEQDSAALEEGQEGTDVHRAKAQVV
eukprot:Nitzschia sp. Nitz4//scaffold41_size133979//102318//104138//NITZ4_003363-RA/size133979-processed-gene-0.89-mRNA-1//-1//CDS//3329551518//5878//frame0